MARRPLVKTSQVTEESHGDRRAAATSKARRSRAAGGTRAAQKASRHVEQIDRVLGRVGSDTEFDKIAPSWKRCVNLLKVDAEGASPPLVLTSRELDANREGLGELIDLAQDGLDRLYRSVRDAGYTVLLCDPAGVAVDQRIEPTDLRQFRHWGVCLGGVWAEAAEGTNGIGTCIAEERPITVHRGQHYRSRHIDLSCSGAPIFDPDGRLAAVLDVSAVDPRRSEYAHGLTGPVTVSAAAEIEEQLFRSRFGTQWIVAAFPPGAAPNSVLLAIDDDRRLVGANRAARARLALDDQKLRDGVSLESLFDCDDALPASRDAGERPIVLVVRADGEGWPALLTSPAPQAAVRRRPGASGRLAEGRVGLQLAANAPSLRGGLPPALLRRLDEYIEARLDENIDLADLAGLAGLSVFHFARQFKNTLGVTPHYYLLRKRLERARKLVAHSDLSLAEIAAATGFADQSHLTRHFGKTFGTTPGQFRRIQV